MNAQTHDLTALPRREPVMNADFSPIASRYDATRDIPDRMLTACYDRLVAQGLFPARGAVLDAGCGTGQISLPLAARGYIVRGIDVSATMVALAQAKVMPGWRAFYATSDVCKIPEGSGTFDAVVVSKLFQHVRDWRGAVRELVRVVKPGLPLVQITDRGAFSNAVRRQFAARADALGFTNRYVGLDPRNDETLVAYMTHLGCTIVRTDMTDVQWETRLSYGEAISRLRERLFAEFWYLPAPAYEAILDETLRWIKAQPAGEDTVEILQPKLEVTVFQRPQSVRL